MTLYQIYQAATDENPSQLYAWIEDFLDGDGVDQEVKVVLGQLASDYSKSQISDHGFCLAVVRYLLKPPSDEQV